MAERNPQVPHYIDSLLYVKKRRNYCGYKLDLITETISTEWERFLFCSECRGISRRARQRVGNTVCEMCFVGYKKPNLDERIVNKVASLNAKCPLSGNGCNWEGKLGKIEKHMNVCIKVLVECHLKCGIVFERETNDQHDREICPLRKKQCQYCKQEVQVNKEDKHIKKCAEHPDREVPCPYKELGCDTIVLWKNKDIHLTENMVGHQKLMLDQLSQLRNRNQQLEQLQEEQRGFNGKQSSRIRSVETSVENEKNWGIGIERKSDKDRRKLIIAFVAVGNGIAIALIGIVVVAVLGIAVGVSQGNHIQANYQQIETIKDSLVILSEYIEERGKELPGVEWKYDLSEIGDIYGPNFYLGQCRLRLKATVTKSYTYYLVERQKGEFDWINADCPLTYIYATFRYLENIKPAYNISRESNTNLKVGTSLEITGKVTGKWDVKGRARIYFDNSQPTESYSQSIKANSELILNNSQQIGSRGKVLQGREWIHNVNGISISGPAFYLEQCKLKLRIDVLTVDSGNGRIYVMYYVERIEGEYDDQISNCKITYIYANYWNLNKSQLENAYSIVTSSTLKAGDSKQISNSTWIDLNTKIRLRVYFDTEGT